MDKVQFEGAFFTARPYGWTSMAENTIVLWASYAAYLKLAAPVTKTVK